ncbi:hypothetical protein SD70_16285 [Gordoniibacillus kamchatkensis]|uniref:YheC/YheD family protein n=1 Tax=Gordoniibacillus kamchatkensis TaxID=1590651 RepID=A0ABR5AHM1_9BACL|nr:YheC/YheD family protein [Paenibacillus sp. VKM B-2647]KIL40075.1 hypothetical protein SD70_16285 [Paenibacillus sp. VKM B-2647]
MPGKWGLHTFYSKAPHLARLLPHTRPLGKASFAAMLDRYGSVYVKPNMEHTGKGIMKVWKTTGSYLLVKVKSRPRSFSANDKDKLVECVLRLARGKPHIVQQTIPLAELNGRPYDIRVMMMRDGTDRWRYTGMLAKVAGPSSVVTNVRRGRGYATTVRHALERSNVAQGASAKRLERELVRLSYAICRRFGSYKYSSQIGIDFGVDRSGKLWLIEVNFDYPSHALFARLPDKTPYRLIKRRRAEYVAAMRRRKRK